MEGRIQRFDYAIFADTQDEPGAEERRLGLPDPPESVYAHLDWMMGLNGPTILVPTAGRLSDDLIAHRNVNGAPLGACIPAYVGGDGERGMMKRQCTKDYKIRVIEQCIRRRIVGLSPKERLPKGVIVHQYIGISWDERSRAFDVRRRFLNEDGQEKRNWRVHFPLLTMNGEMKPGWTRDDCDRYLELNVPHKVYGSACIYCPFKDDPTWARSMQPGPTRDRLIHIDRAIRVPGTSPGSSMDQKLYLHRECRPIDQIDFLNEKQLGFAMECEGGCGL
jgi:hypothetical protein